MLVVDGQTKNFVGGRGRTNRTALIVKEETREMCSLWRTNK